MKKRRSRSRWTLCLALFSAAAVGVLAQGGQLAFPAGFSNGVLKDGLDEFRDTDEGPAEEQELIESGVDVEIVTYHSDDNWGETEVTETDADGNPTKIEIRVATNDPGSAKNVAETIKHEMRHAEIFIGNGDDEREKHDALDDGTDQRLNDFKGQL